MKLLQENIEPLQATYLGRFSFSVFSKKLAIKAKVENQETFNIVEPIYTMIENTYECTYDKKLNNQRNIKPDWKMNEEVNKHFPKEYVPTGNRNMKKTKTQYHC